MTELQSRPLFRLEIDLHPTLEAGATPHGLRRIFPVAGGRFHGDRLSGAVLPETSGDWLLARQDGTFQQDVRLLLQTNDGALILMSYRGVRRASTEVTARMTSGEHVDRSEYYLRTAPFFETSAPQYAWINQIVSVGVGERLNGAVAYDIFEIL